MRINIKSFHFSHFNELINMLQELSVFYPNFLNFDSIYKEFISQKNLCYIASFLENQLVGFESIFIFPRVRGNRKATIENLNVSENYRKLGFGSKILEIQYPKQRYKNVLRLNRNQLFNLSYSIINKPCKRRSIMEYLI